MTDFLLRSLDDKLAYPIRITRDFKQWNSRKCWAVHCNNEINIVHVSEFGNATHGYCFWCFRSGELFRCLYGDSERGKWVECIKDYKTKKPKLKERKDRELYEKQLRVRYGT